MNSKRLTYHFIFSVLILFFSVFFFSNSIYAQREFSVRNVDHFGGYATTAAVSGDYVFLCQGTVLAVLEISDNGFSKIASLTLPEEPGDCCIHNNHLYLFHWRNGIRVIDILDPSNPDTVASLKVREGDNWGQGKIHAAENFLYIALQDSVKIIDISNPVSPFIVSTILTSVRDVFVQQNYLFVSGQNEFKIFDLTDMQNPIEIGSSDISRSNCVFVQGNFAYVGIEEYPDYGLQIFDISDPGNPTKLGFFETKKVIGNHTWFHNPQQVAVEGNYAYIGCRAQGSTLYIADVSDPANPIEAGNLEFDEGSFPGFESLQLQYPYLYAATGMSSVGFIMINISDPAFPEIEHRYEEPWDPQAMATCGDTLYVSSIERLWVYDYSDTSNPALLGSDTTWAELSKIQVQNNYLYGSKENNLYILDVNDPNNIFEVGNYSSANGDIIESVMYENFVYLLTVSETQSLLEIVNLSNPNLPVEEAAEFVVPGKGRDFCLLPDSMFALIAYSVDETNQGFQIIDISDLSELIVLGSAQTTGNPMSIGVADTLAIVGSNTVDNWYLEAFNIVDPTNPVNIGSTNGGGFTFQTSTNSNFSQINNNFSRLNKYRKKFDSPKFEIQSDAPKLTSFESASIADFAFVQGLNFQLKNEFLIAVSIHGGSVHFYSLQPGAGTVEWILQAICHSPASTVIAAIAHPFFMTIFSIDGWMDPITKKVSGSLGIFVQRLLLKAYLAAISIEPPDSSVELGDKVQFQAKGKDNSGNDMDVTVTWSASGGDIDPETGEYTATEAGDFTIIGTDSSYGIEGTATVHVTATGVSTTKILPRQFSLSQNYPNPFNPTTSIVFSVKERCLVLLEIYDIRGRVITTLINQEQQPGTYRVNFDARNLPSGIYFYQIKMKNFTDVKKMVVLE